MLNPAEGSEQHADQIPASQARMGYWKGGKSSCASPSGELVVFSPVSHFSLEEGTGRLVEIRNGNAKVSTYCIKSFKLMQALNCQ